MSGTIDLFSKLRKKKTQEDAVAVAEAINADSNTPVVATVEEPALGINPPEKDLPPAPPVGSVEAKPKRGRPSKKAPEMVETKSGPELVAEMAANAKPQSEHIEQFFVFDHLPEKLREVSRPFGELAKSVVETLPRNPERTVALRKLLEAKDAAVRAALAK